jgi:hypothetical protein
LLSADELEVFDNVLVFPTAKFLEIVNDKASYYFKQRTAIKRLMAFSDHDFSIPNIGDIHM